MAMLLYLHSTRHYDAIIKGCRIKGDVNKIAPLMSRLSKCRGKLYEVGRRDETQ